jgi:hypothetical protein
MTERNGADQGADGFLSIFGRPISGDSPDTPETPTPETTTEEDAAPQAATVADTSAPETDSSLSDEDRVIARFAALEEDAEGDIPEPGQAVADGDDDEDPLAADEDEDLDLDAMTPEQLRELAEEALRIRAEDGEADRAEVAQKVQAAEEQALQRVQAQFHQEVVVTGERHYRAIRNKQLAGLVREAMDKEQPERHILAGMDAILNNIDAHKQQWINKQAEAEEWTGRVQQSVAQARASVPELRQAYAEQLVEERGLPKKAVDFILKKKGGSDRAIDDFEERADELLAQAKALGKVKAKGRAETKEEGRKRLIEQRVSTVATSRPRREEPVEYKGTAREGLAILSRLRG